MDLTQPPWITKLRSRWYIWIPVIIIYKLAESAMLDWARHRLAERSGWIVQAFSFIVTNLPFFTWLLITIGAAVLFWKSLAERSQKISHGLAKGDKHAVAPVPAESRSRHTQETTDEIILPSEVPEATRYAQWVGEMRLANRDGQLVGVVVNFGNAAQQFDSKQKIHLATVLSEYVDAHGFKPPLVMQDYIEFEFVPRPDGRHVWLRADREGVVAIEVWRSWPQVPWDWLLAEAYSSLLCLRDKRIIGLFQSGGIVEAALTLGNLLGPGGTTPDVGVTTRGLRSNLVPWEEVRGIQPRFPSVQYDCGTTMNTDPWGCAKAFVKQAMADTGVLLFEEQLEAVDKDNFLGMYFETPGAFRRPQASANGA